MKTRKKILLNPWKNRIDSKVLTYKTLKEATSDFSFVFDDNKYVSPSFRNKTTEKIQIKNNYNYWKTQKHQIITYKYLWKDIYLKEYKRMEFIIPIFVFASILIINHLFESNQNHSSLYTILSIVLPIIIWVTWMIFYKRKLMKRIKNPKNRFFFKSISRKSYKYTVTENENWWLDFIFSKYDFFY